MFFLRIQLISLFPAPRRPRLFSPSSHHRNANLIRKEEERGDGIIIECRLPLPIAFLDRPRAPAPSARNFGCLLQKLNLISSLSLLQKVEFFKVE